MRKPNTINDAVISQWIAEKTLRSNMDLNIVMGVHKVANQNTKPLTQTDLDQLATCFITR